MDAGSPCAWTAGANDAISPWHRHRPNGHCELASNSRPRGAASSSELAAHSRWATPIIAALVAGDFTLPRNAERKLAFIAGGIGITPFRSMVKYLTDRGEDRNVVMLYANRRYEEIVYRDVFAAAARTFHFRPVYVLSDDSSAPPFWHGEVGRIDAAMIETANTGLLRSVVLRVRLPRVGSVGAAVPARSRA